MSAILTELADGIFTIRFNRPEKKNALTAAMYESLAATLIQARDDDDVRVVLVAGSARCFTSGNDIADFLERPPEGENSPVARFMQALSTLPKPVVAAVEGVAVGVGVTLLLHCDLSYVGEGAHLQLPFVNIGLCPEFAASYLMPLAMGLPRASELLMLGAPFTPTTARDCGIVNAVVPAGEAEAHARRAALRLAAQPPEALRVCKQLLRAPHAAAVAQVMKTEVGHFMPMLRAPEAREAMSAFMEKRAADFSKLR